MMSAFCLARPGDLLFATNSVHDLRLTFSEPFYWDSLLSSHTTGNYVIGQVNFDGTILDSCGIKTKGNSSFSGSGEKKSFKIDLNNYISGQDIDGLNKLNLNNGFKDPTFMREKLALDFMNAHGIAAPRCTYTNLYINGQLWGIYFLVEEVDGDFCKTRFSNKTGNLFKGDPHGTLQYRGPSPSSYYPEYELHSNELLNDWTDLANLIDKINNTSTTAFHDSMEKYLNADLFIQQSVITNLFVNLDSYTGSGHNYFIYDNDSTHQFEWIAWDVNEVFGTFRLGLTDAQLKNLSIYYISNPSNARPLLFKFFQNTTYKNLYNERYCELFADFTHAYFDAKIDSLKELIKADVYADPKKLYSNLMFDQNIESDYSSGGPGGGSYFGLKSFITERSNAVQHEMDSLGICNLNSIASENESFQLQIFPNPAKLICHLISSTPIHSIQLFDAQGALVFEKNKLNHYSYDLSLADYKSGFYLLQINSGKPSKLLIN
jgi:hypothetical protein